MKIGDRVTYAGDDAVGTVVEIHYYEFAGDVPYLTVQYEGHQFTCHDGAFTLVEDEEEESCTRT